MLRQKSAQFASRRQNMLVSCCVATDIAQLASTSIGAHLARSRGLLSALPLSRDAAARALQRANVAFDGAAAAEQQLETYNRVVGTALPMRLLREAPHLARRLWRDPRHFARLLPGSAARCSSWRSSPTSSAPWTSFPRPFSASWASPTTRSSFWWAPPSTSHNLERRCVDPTSHRQHTSHTSRPAAIPSRSHLSTAAATAGSALASTSAPAPRPSPRRRARAARGRGSRRRRSPATARRPAASSP